MAQLMYSDAAGQKSVLDLADREVLIGRLAECDIVIAKGFVSRRHARIFPAEGGWTVEDLNSSHGTYVNRLRISEKQLEPGDQIQIGDEVIQFQDGTNQLKYKTGETHQAAVTHVAGTPQEDDEVVHAQPVEQGDIMRTVLGAQIADLTQLTSSPNRSVAQLISQPEPGEVVAPEPEKSLRDDAEVARRLGVVFNVAADLRRCTDIAGACRIAITKAMEVVNADRGVIALRDDEASPFVPQIQLSNESTDTSHAPVRVSTTTLDQMVAERSALFCYDTKEDSALSAARSIVAQSIRSIICAPLWDGQNILGYIYLDSSEAGRLREEHLDLINAVGYLAAAEVARLRAIKMLKEEEFQRQSLSRFFSKDVVTHILDEAKAGRLDPTTAQEHQTVTILFADICGFTRMSEQMAADHVKLFLNEYFEVMSEVLVEKHRGALDKFIGDAIMALYGAPFSQGVQADARRAIAAAVEMREQVQRLRAEKPDIYGKLQIRVGINTGKVVAGYIGPEWRMQYTVLGDAVNVASRLETTSEPGEIQIGEVTYNLVKDAFECVSAGARQVKNRDEPVHSWYVTGPRGE